MLARKAVQIPATRSVLQIRFIRLYVDLPCSRSFTTDKKYIVAKLINATDGTY